MDLNCENRSVIFPSLSYANVYVNCHGAGIDYDNAFVSDFDRGYGATVFFVGKPNQAASCILMSMMLPFTRQICAVITRRGATIR